MLERTNYGRNRRTFLQSVAAALLGPSVAFGKTPSTVSGWTGGETNSVLNRWAGNHLLTGIDLNQPTPTSDPNS